MNKSGCRAGFTLIEIVIAIAIMGIATLMAWPLIRYSSTAQERVHDEAMIQSDVRLAAEELTQHIRHATVGFTVTDTQLTNPGMTREWDYFVLEQNKRQISYFQWQDTGGGVFAHVRKVIVPEREGISYNLTFHQNTAGSQKVAFRLDGYYDSASDMKMTVESELIALNSVVIDDLGTAADPAVALAFRSDPAPKPSVNSRPVKIAVTMVLDESGSMNERLGGRRKNAILKEKAKAMVDDFIEMGNVSVCVIPYSNSATPGTMYDATVANSRRIKTDIDGVGTSGATNTGDGMRRAYWVLDDYRTRNAGTDVVCYMMLLTDGDPTLYSIKSGTYQLDAAAMSSSDGDGDDNIDNINECMLYVKEVGDRLFKTGPMDIKSYVIAFASSESQVTRAETIAETHCTSPTDPDREGTYFFANSEVALENAMTTITDTIIRETWHIYGPY